MARHDLPRRNPYERDHINWVPVATAPDQVVAEMWQEMLREESIPSMLAPEDAVSFLGISASPVRVLVPEEMKARAEELLADSEEGSETGAT